jgi:hypothetical protein
MRGIKSWWQTFIYNYQWSDYVVYIDGWIPKLAFSVPILGYLILFNDKTSDFLIFQQLANEHISSFGLSGVQRLRLLYFGLIFLGISNFIYRVRKPYQFKFGSNYMDYSRCCLEIFTLSNYNDIHHQIRREGHLTVRGKYYDSEWDGFLNRASNTDEGKNTVARDGDWEAAKKKYGSLLLDMLYENFFRSDRGRRGWLTVCLLLSSFGYVCLLFPSFDLFIKVLLSMIGVQS